MAVEEKGIPFLGLCLGHQLLAESLGGVVGKSETAEVGVMEVQLTEEGATGFYSMVYRKNILPPMAWC